MSSEPTVLEVIGIGKLYRIYSRPADRLWQFFISFGQRLWPGSLQARYREFHALRDISFQLQRGESLGIIGRNGCGKSTLLQLICGTLHPSFGQIQVMGRIAALLELGAGFNASFTGRENVYLNASLLGLSQEQTDARFASIAEFADIGEHMEQAIHTYSSGMVVRLAFAVLAHVDADILVIDEALAVGDALFTQKCMRFLRDFMQHKTVLFVSHDIEALKALCQRVIWLNKGKIVRDGPTKAVCQDYLDFLFAGQQSSSTKPLPAPEKAVSTGVIPRVDGRLKYINESNLRNDIRISAFEPPAAGIGTGGATIQNVHLRDTQGQPLSWVVGGEVVELQITIECHTRIASPIIGFMVKDRTGQALFGDNTWLSYLDVPVNALDGDTLQASFVFDMPRLPPGDYNTVVAIVDGTQQDGTYLHWQHEALHFRSETSSVASGLVGLPMRSVRLQRSPDRNTKHTLAGGD